MLEEDLEPGQELEKNSRRERMNLVKQSFIVNRKKESVEMLRNQCQMLSDGKIIVVYIYYFLILNFDTANNTDTAGLDELLLQLEKEEKVININELLLIIVSQQAFLPKQNSLL